MIRNDEDAHHGEPDDACGNQQAGHEAVGFSFDGDGRFFDPRKIFHPENAIGTIRGAGKPFVMFGNETFGGEFAEEKYFSLFGHVVFGRSNGDALIRAGFDENDVIQIGEIELKLPRQHFLRAHAGKLA